MQMQLPQGRAEPPLNSALERKLEELEDKGLIRILRGLDADAIMDIEVIPNMVEATVVPSVLIEVPSSTSTGTAPLNKFSP